MKRFPLLLTFLLSTSVTLVAKTWQVGPARTYRAPSDVSALVHNGDTVAIDGGIYVGDVARWAANDLVLMGVGGRAHMRANGNSYGGKAIWVISGNNVTVESIEFSLCTVPDNNGAGIREEGTNLTVRDCYFHDNQDGILAGDNSESDIVIEHCEFFHNGAGDGFSHNLYINHVRSLTFRFNYSHGAVSGHELKSRAYATYVLYNRLATESDGTGSREIDLPNGGTAIVVGNEIQQGESTENSNMVGYGLEGLSNPGPQRLIMVNNTIVNERHTGVFVNVKDGTDLVEVINNIAAGPGTFLSGTADSVVNDGNVVTSVADAGLVDPTSNDYELMASSPAVDAGVVPRTIDTFDLRPTFEYRATASGAPRPIAGSIDAGAHEFVPATAVPASSLRAEFSITPNPLTTTAMIRLPDGMRQTSISICTLRGEEVARIPGGGSQQVVVHRGRLSAGVYLVRIVRPDSVPEFMGTLIVE